MSTKIWSKRAQKAHRKAWVAALRSGEYRQTKNTLTDGRGFCCLGVACEISKLGYWRDGPHGEELWVYETGTDSSDHHLPVPVMEWLGLSDNDGQFDAGDGWTVESLTQLNDTGKTFKRIAMIIEAEPSGLIDG